MYHSQGWHSKETISPPVSEKKKTAISAHTIREWMMLNYCEVIIMFEFLLARVHFVT